jgi:hypothetical protein
MKTPPSWQDEKQRLGVLGQYAMLDTPPEEAFDCLTMLTAQFCEAPIVRDISFSGPGSHQSGSYIVPDATRDERFADNHRNASEEVPGEANWRNGSRRLGVKMLAAPVGRANHGGLRT